MARYKLNQYNKESIGYRLRKFRKAIQKTQADIAHEASVSQANVARMESGDVFPNITYLSYLHKYYKMNTNWLISGEGEMLENNVSDHSYKSFADRIKFAFPEIKIDDTLIEVCQALANPKLTKLIRHKFAIALGLAEAEFPHIFNEQGDRNNSVNVGGV